MKNIIKKLIVLGMALCLSVSFSIISLADEWIQDSKGWKAKNSDGSYIIDSWYQATDGLWYYIGADGYMLYSSWTPDNYYVGTNGAMVDSVKKFMEIDNGDGTKIQVEVIGVEDDGSWYGTTLQGAPVASMGKYGEFGKEMYDVLVENWKAGVYAGEFDLRYDAILNLGLISDENFEAIIQEIVAMDRSTAINTTLEAWKMDFANKWKASYNSASAESKKTDPELLGVVKHTFSVPNSDETTAEIAHDVCKKCAIMYSPNRQYRYKWHVENGMVNVTVASSTGTVTEDMLN
ncbi:hypothetical protein DWX10_27270 [Clostridium sp. AF18-27]|uniref:hypothetical protein n=1 Tax=Enterocloster lavalensis TaxID=460384 RepID=UPI000E53672C|nr:hypothetical protein [Enterocloster lavalensis]RHR46059.1 hypothetical protein DWX10_27270 [Clostridium sp. AF18-27]